MRSGHSGCVPKCRAKPQDARKLGWCGCGGWRCKQCAAMQAGRVLRAVGGAARDNWHGWTAASRTQGCSNANFARPKVAECR
eukprot:9487574-Pyramimonas_sp.AAC.1